MVSRLKSLELQGYKTFANRTVFDYTSSITAIIGPNGSGKSNIADSMRWVLGEQSYSLLRGKKTEDMIFSGSEQRPRASMAAVTMVFDNSDNWLPIDFTEVAVTRRAYRDGQNEYLINGQRVRLKDVFELLAQSGLAERTYTIIGQGLVDATLALKAEERRKLFEEAAGIGLYRTRREEALRRLEVTRRNLERVQDILAELQPRLKSLEKQSQRAQEYEQVKAELRELLLVWYGFHWHAVQTELTELAEIVSVREKALNEARNEQQAIEAQIQTMRLHIQNLRNQLNAYHHALSQYYQQRESLTRDKAVIEEKMNAGKIQLLDLQNNINHQVEEADLHKKAIEEISADLRELESELKDAHEQANASQTELAGRQNERLVIERLLEEGRKIYNTLISRKSEMGAIIAERQSQIIRYQKSIDAKSDQIEALRIEINQVRERIKPLEEVIQKKKIAKSELEVKELSLADQRRQLGEKEKSLTEKRLKIISTISNWKTQLELLVQAENALTGYSSGVKIIREAQESKKLSGVSGYLGNSIHAPARYETAIAAALGENLNAILYDSNLSIDLALDILLENAARGILFPINGHKTNLVNISQETPGYIGRASELVQVASKFREILDALLGNVLVVDDRKSARNLLQSGIPGFNVVTLKGEVFNSNGAIVIGTEGKSTVLSHSRRKREATSSIQKSERQLVMVDREIADIQAKTTTLIHQESAIQEELEEINRSIEQYSLNLSRENQKQGQIAKEIGWLKEQLQTINQQITQARLEISNSENELEIIKADIQKAEREIYAQEEHLKGQEATEYQEQLVHWNAIVQITERAINDANKRRAEHQANLAKIEDLMEEGKSKQAELIGSLKTLEEKKLGLQSEEASIAALINETQGKVEPTEKKLSEAEKQADSLAEQENLIKKRFSVHENQYSQARINLVRLQERFEGLSKRIEDDFGLVAFEYNEKVSGPTPLPLEGMVQKLPRVGKLPPDLEEKIKEYRSQLRKIGSVNLEAQAEYVEVQTRYNFMLEQVNDLEKAELDVRQGITELDLMMQQEFQKTFEAVSEEFIHIFSRLFAGGSARLVLTETDNLSDTGIDIEARLPGRRSQGLSLLSGGERSLTATALIFALLKVSPTPFCLLDEVDAMLDEANVGRFNEVVRELSEKTQFIIVTHNRNTVQVADVIYGVTMGRDSTSQVISLKLEDVEKII